MGAAAKVFRGSECSGSLPTNRPHHRVFAVSKTEMGRIRVLVASEYELMRSALCQLLKTDDAFVVLPAESDCKLGLPRLYQRMSPDVLLLEVATKSAAIMRIPADILSTVPHARIILLSSDEDVTFVRSMFATGVLGYVLKAAAHSELFQAIRNVHRGRPFVDPRISNSMANPQIGVNNATRRFSIGKLSRRESEVLRAIAFGYTTKQIADAMNVSAKTVQTYRERIYTKLDLETRSDLVHYAVAHGLGWEAKT